MARGNNRRTGYEEVTGQTPDISEWLDFEFYDLVWWWHLPGKPNVTDNPRRLACWLGVSHHVGSDLCYWLVTDTGKLVSNSSIQQVTRDDYLQEDMKQQIDEFNKKCEERLNDKNFLLFNKGFQGMYIEDIEDLMESHSDVIHEKANTPGDKDYGENFPPERPEDDDEEATDKYLNAELILGLGTNDERRGRVVKRARNLGESVGRAHNNPLFDTREYDVEFTDRSRERYQAIVIAENMFAQFDSEDRQYQILDEIIDHRKDNTAVPISEGMIQGPNGEMKPKITTQGHEFLCSFKDGSMDWVKLKDLKESNGIQIAEFVVANRLVEEPAFKWWVPKVLRKRNRIISKVKSRYWKTTHKFGIRLRHSVEEALRIDEETGTDFWRRAINKEMSKVKVAWKVHEGHTPEEVRIGKAKYMIGYQKIGCHMVFDIKMDFSRKARFVAGGHTTEAPTSMTYSSVVSRESVRLAFLIARKC
jgi:hypothetical protein